MGRRARLGPTRSCIRALHLRSAMVSSVAVTMISTRMSATMLPIPSPRPPAMLGRSWKIVLKSQTMKYSTQETASSTPANAAQPTTVAASHARNCGLGG